MTPSFSTIDASDAEMRYSENFRNVSVLHCLKQFSYSPYFFVIKFCFWMINAPAHAFRMPAGKTEFSTENIFWMESCPMLITRRRSSFFGSVRIVPCLCSSPKMFWVRAFSVITFMANAMSFRDFSEMNYPRRLMRFSAFASDGKTPITIPEFRSFPFPASSKIRSVFWNSSPFIHFCPKVLNCPICKIVDSLANGYDRVHSMIYSSGLRLCDYFRRPIPIMVIGFI